MVFFKCLFVYELSHTYSIISEFLHTTIIPKSLSVLLFLNPINLRGHKVNFPFLSGHRDPDHPSGRLGGLGPDTAQPFFLLLGRWRWPNWQWWRGRQRFHDKSFLWPFWSWWRREADHRVWSGHLNDPRQDLLIVLMSASLHADGKENHQVQGQRTGQHRQKYFHMLTAKFNKLEHEYLQKFNHHYNNSSI